MSVDPNELQDFLFTLFCGCKMQRLPRHDYRWRRFDGRSSRKTHFSRGRYTHRKNVVRMGGWFFGHRCSSKIMTLAIIWCFGICYLHLFIVCCCCCCCIMELLLSFCQKIPITFLCHLLHATYFNTTPIIIIIIIIISISCPSTIPHPFMANPFIPSWPTLNLIMCNSSSHHVPSLSIFPTGFSAPCFNQQFGPSLLACYFNTTPTSHIPSSISFPTLYSFIFNPLELKLLPTKFSSFFLSTSGPSFAHLPPSV